MVAVDRERIYARELEIPSGGGVGTARAIAKAYGVFATDGRELGLRPETLAALRAPAVPPARGFHDACFRGEVQFSLGFMKPTPNWPFGHEGAFGAPGAGGSLPADRRRARHGYVTSRIGTVATASPRRRAPPPCRCSRRRFLVAVARGLRASRCIPAAARGIAPPSTCSARRRSRTRTRLMRACAAVSGQGTERSAAGTPSGLRPAGRRGHVRSGVRRLDLGQ
jgi:hypothetical protein